MKPRIESAMPIVRGGRPRPPVKVKGKCGFVSHGGKGWAGSYRDVER